MCKIIINGFKSNIMKSIHILAVHNVLPENKSATTIILENIVNELKKKTQVHVTWLVYR